MSFLMFVGLTYSAYATGSTGVGVRCEKCDKKYYYKLTRTARGQGTAPYGMGEASARKLARQNARRHLERMLDEDIDPVPCPECGWYQEAMKRHLRGNLLPGFRTGAIFSLVGGGVLIFFGLLTLAADRGSMEEKVIAALLCAGIGLLALLAAGVLLLVRRLKNARFDPNVHYTAEQRIALGRKHSITKDEARKLKDSW